MDAVKNKKIKNIRIFGRVEEVVNEEEQRFINQCKIADLKKLVSPYVKNNYQDISYLIEDVIVGLLENPNSAIDIIDRPF